MSRHIYIRLGSTEAIQPGNLITSLRYSYDILRELDAAVSGETNGAVEWGIDCIEKQSPATIAFVGLPRSLDVADPMETIQSTLIDGINVLAKDGHEPLRPRLYSDKALKAAKGLSDLGKKADVGEIEVYASEHVRARITRSVSSAVQFLIGTAVESLGSIVGNLDSITVHKNYEFRVWDEVSRRAVTCKFAKDMIDSVKEELKHRVLVYGTIKRNEEGLPVCVDVKGVEKQPHFDNLPSIEEMSGLIDDVTEGATLKEYLKDLRGG